MIRFINVLLLVLPFFAQQAYVPDMQPAYRVEPVYPEAARGRGIRGNVHLLLTLDPTGHVTGTEVLAGREILRQPAIDAVKEWRFHPVLRYEGPVAAYTDVKVYFAEEGITQGVPDEEARAEVAEELAAGGRIGALAIRFRRKPSEVLADLAQHGDHQSSEYRAALPDLVKMAIEAGELDKANVYGQELIQSAKNPKDWNYGNAIYDGNTALGRVALRKGDVAQAKRFLMAAANTPGSQRLSSSGPDLSLARELAFKGERKIVLEFFSSCKRFWKQGGLQLDGMSASVRAGGLF